MNGAKADHVVIQQAIIDALTREYNLSETQARLLFESLRAYELEQIIEEHMVGEVFAAERIEKSAERVADKMVSVYE